MYLFVKSEKQTFGSLFKNIHDNGCKIMTAIQNMNGKYSNLQPIESELSARTTRPRRYPSSMLLLLLLLLCCSLL